MVALEALGNRVLVKKLKPEEVTPSGIFIPPTAQANKQCIPCIVTHVGPGSRNGSGERMPIDLVPGDEVFASRFAMEDIEIDGEHYNIALEQDILCKITRNGNGK